MKKQLLIMAASAAVSPLSYADEQVETITVTATRAVNQSLSTLATQVTLERADIELAQAETVPELLSRFAGIDVAQNGAGRQVSSVFMRGASSDQTLVLVNGLRVNTASSGAATWYTMSVDLIERIEIVKGPRAAVWGSDAIGGVINIITRTQSPGSVTVNAKYGTNNTQAYYLGGSVGHGDGATTIAVTKERSDGLDVLKTSEPDEDGYDNVSFTVNGAQSISERIALNWLFKSAQQDTDFDSTYLNKSEDETQEWQIGGAYNWHVGGVSNTSSLSVGATKDKNLSFGNGRDKKDGDLFETRRDQLTLSNTTQFNEAFSLVVGTDQYEEELVSSTDFAQTERRIEGYFGHGLVDIGRFTAELALRYDDVENVDSESTYNAGVGFNITDALLVSVAKGTGFKAPTFNDLYFPFGGNAELLSETSETEEVSITYQTNTVDASLSYYTTDIENLIEWAPDADNIWQPRNIAQAEISGVDIIASYSGFGGRHTVNYGYLDAVDARNDTRLARRAKNQFSYQFMASFDTTDFLFNYEYKGDRVDQGTTLESYQIVDVSVNHRFSDVVSGKLKLHNLFDEEYETVFNYQTLGRAVYLSINYQM